MAFQYIGVEEAKQRDGLRMVVVGTVPSPWGEAAKGILHVKGIDWAAVRLQYDSDSLRQWAGQLSGPVAIYDNEPPRAGWAEILLLAERLVPEPSLLPASPIDRALAFGIGHEICGEGGLGWSRRLQLIHAGLRNEAGFPERIAKYLARKYGYTAATAAACSWRVTEVLGMLTMRLKSQHENGSRYYIAHSMTAVDIYSATFMALFRPLARDHCDMDANIRAAFETRFEQTEAALDPILLEHRDMMYADHLELPLAL